MEILLIIVLVISIGMLLSDGFRTPPAPPVILVQAPIAEPASGGVGCLPLMLIGGIILVLLLNA